MCTIKVKYYLAITIDYIRLILSYHYNIPCFDNNVLITFLYPAFTEQSVTHKSYKVT